MNPNEEALTEAERIVREAEMDRYDESNESIDLAITLAEQKAYDENPLAEDECVYDFYLFQQEFQGSPDQLAEFKRRVVQENPNIDSVHASVNEEPNTCVSCMLILKATAESPADIKECLYDKRFAIAIHTHFKDHEIVGLMVRTLAETINEDDGTKTEAIVTCCVINDRIGNIVRRTDNGEVQFKQFYPVASWKNSELDTIKECAEILSDKYGNIPAALYMAVHGPQAAKRTDPEMWDAAVSDFLDSKSKETEQE